MDPNQPRLTTDYEKNTAQLAIVFDIKHCIAVLHYGALSPVIQKSCKLEGSVHPLYMCTETTRETETDLG